MTRIMTPSHDGAENQYAPTFADVEFPSATGCSSDEILWRFSHPDWRPPSSEVSQAFSADILSHSQV